VLAGVADFQSACSKHRGRPDSCGCSCPPTLRCGAGCALVKGW
jgi:hypothetical protein